METNGIGTDASMSTHINNISERNYVKVESGARRLVPTQLGLALVATYKKILPDLVAPSLRSNIERQCNLIAKGQADFEDVVKDVIRIFQ
jgi:DNA topoisomerase-3